MKIAGYLLFILALSAACATMNAKAGGAGYSAQEKTLMLGSGETLRYTLALPPSSSPGEARALIVALHYGGEVTPYYGKPYLTSLVLPALRELGAIMVAPDCPGKGWTDPLSEKAVLELIQRVQEDHRVDPERLVVTGYSLGAIGVWDLVFKHPHVFSAAIPVSGTPPKGIVVRPTDTGFWVIHSSDDEVIPIEPVRKFVRSGVSEGLSIRFYAVANLGHYEYDRYVPALKRAVPWLKGLWDGKSQPALSSDFVHFFARGWSSSTASANSRGTSTSPSSSTRARASQSAGTSPWTFRPGPTPTTDRSPCEWRSSAPTGGPLT